MGAQREPFPFRYRDPYGSRWLYARSFSNAISCATSIARVVASHQDKGRVELESLETGQLWSVGPNGELVDIEPQPATS